MRLTTVILIASLMQVSAAGLAQKISLSKSNASLKTVLREIKTKTGYNFIYRDRVLEKAKPVTISVNHTEVEEVLKQIFENQELSYSIDSKTVIIQPKEPSFLDNLVARFRAIDVSGRVVDEKGQPLPGATVKVKDGKGGTMTDGQGRFLIENVSEGAVIVISYTGYVAQEVAAKQNMGSITLKLSENPLDQVQIIAYGTQSKRLSVGNVGMITAKEIENQPVNNPLLALQGRIPGVDIQQANGIPGGGITVRIQGRNNIDNSLVGSDPFIVIDGVPYQSQNLNTFKGGSTAAPILGISSNDGIGSPTTRNFGSPLAYLNPADIESIAVLKDADATAIYGSRAANGAILITTKKGRVGQLKTDVNLQNGWGQVGDKMDLLNSQQYMEMRREAKRNDGSSISITDYDLRGLWDTTSYTNWQDKLIGGTAQFTRLTAGVSGGTSTVQYLLSSTYGRETTVFPGDFSNTFGSLHFNISAMSTNQRFKVQLGGSYMAGMNKLPTEDYTTYALNLPPVAPALYNADGTLNWAPDPLQNGNSSWFNPLSRNYSLFETKTNNLVSNGSLSYQIISGLELKSTFGYTSTISDQFMATLDESVRPEDRPTRISSRNAIFSFNNIRSWIVEPQLTFHRKLQHHSIGIMIGSTFQYQSSEGRGFNARGQNSDLLLRNMLAGTSLSSSGIDLSEYNYNALFGRINYSFKDKYLLNFTGRRDGSSRFGSNNQFNNFGAIGAGWILSEEKMFKDVLPVVSFAKFRASYGITGNDQIGDYRFMNLFNSFSTGILYQGFGALSPGGLPNPNLEWEETRKLQFGVDLSFLSDRLNFSATYNRNRTSNSLAFIPMPTTTGFSTLLVNLPAKIQNTGWELSFSSSDVNIGKVKWSTNLNLSIPRNKLLAFPGLENHSLNNSLKIGRPFNTSQTYRYYGVNPLTGTHLVTNKNGDPTNNPDFNTDRTIFVTPTISCYGGIQNSVSFKGFSIDFLVQVTKQIVQDVLQLATYPGIMSSANTSLMFGNQPISVLHRWQKPGDTGPYPRFSALGGGISSLTTGDRVFQDGSFIRLKNVSFSYQFLPSILQKIRVNQLRVFANAQNLLTLTRYQGLDPESKNISSLPPLRVITIGLQSSF